MRSLRSIATWLPLNDDEELELLGFTGQNALSEFPHSRENCVNFIFASTRHEQHCTHCVSNTNDKKKESEAKRNQGVVSFSLLRLFLRLQYCMVCDVPASECKLWNNNHCHAVFGDPAWRKAREQAKRQATQPVVQRQAAPNTTTAAQPRATIVPRSTTWSPILGSHLSIAALLAAATRVYPREVSPPNPPFVTKLRHYQKQSLAFMQEMEQSRMVGWRFSDRRGTHEMYTRGGWLASEGT